VNPSSINPAPLHLSTDEIAKRDRVEKWCEVYGRSILKLLVEPYPDDAFHAALTF
jgi:pantoate kinase